MATTIAKLVTVLAADASQFKNEIDAADAKLKALKEFGKEVLGAFGIGFGAAAVAQFLQSSVAEAEEAAQAQAKLQTALDATGNQSGLTSQQLKEYAQQLSDTTAIQDDVIMSAEAMLVSFGNIRGTILKQAIPAVLDFAKFTGTDAASAARILGKALSDPADALGALSKAGVVFTDEQKRSIKAMVEAGDVAGAQAQIIQKLGSSFGGAAERMATASERLQTSLANLKQEIGGFGGGPGGKGGLIDFIAGDIGKLTRWVELLSQTQGLFKDLKTLAAQEIRVNIPGIARLEKLLDSWINPQKPLQPIIPEDVAGPVGPSKETLQALEEFEQKLQKQIATAGMSADAIKLLEFKEKNLGDAELETARALMQKVDALHADAKAVKELEAAQAAQQRAIESTLTSLEEQFDTIGMSAAGLIEYKMQMRGATAAEIEYAAGLIQSTEQTKRFLSEFTTIQSSSVSDAIEEATSDIAGLTDALDAGNLSLDAYNEAMGKLQDALGKKLEDAGKRLHESLRTPLEKAQDDIRDLNTLLENESITAEDYQRRLAEIKQTLQAPELNDFMNASNPALEFGTAAAFSASRGGGGMERREVEDAKTHEKLEENNRLLERIEQAINNGGRVLVKQF